MKTELQKQLAKIAPSICIQTLWEHDPFSGPISKDCAGFSPKDDHKWQAWQSEICATCIYDGEEITGSAHLGGTYELCGDGPAISNPEISGYENQMTVEALEELAKELPIVSARSLQDQIRAALSFLSTLN